MNIYHYLQASIVASSMKKTKKPKNKVKFDESVVREDEEKQQNEVFVFKATPLFNRKQVHPDTPVPFNGFKSPAVERLLSSRRGSSNDRRRVKKGKDLFDPSKQFGFDDIPLDSNSPIQLQLQ